jgi:uncharacterized protein (DUF433 family)
MMKHAGRIVAAPDIMLGKPVVAGTRITVELIVRKLAGGITVDELIDSYPGLSKDDVFAALEYSADVLAGGEMIPV